jgi:hypothetical protein
LEKTFISGPQPQKAVETNHARGEQALKRKNFGKGGGKNLLGKYSLKI